LLAAELADGSIGEVNFEAIVSCTEIPRTAPVASIWQTLRAESADEASSSLYIRARCPAGEASAPPSSKAWCFERRADRIYGALPAGFEKRQQVDADFIEGLIYLFTNEDGLCEFGRGSSLLAMAVATYCTRLEKSYTFHYDSLQHSATIALAVGRPDPNAVPRGLCSCNLTREATAVELQWETASWNPVVSGFIATAVRD
jgi:hypothetical protein